MKILFDIYITFFKVGITTFGGGYAMLPILQKEIVENKNWVSYADILDYYAVSQCSPGIIAINTSTYIGYQINGNLGGIIAALGVLSPSIIIISLISTLIQNFSTIEIVKHAFAGIQVAVAVIIINSVIKMGQTSITDALTTILFVLSLFLFIFFDLSPLFAIVLTALFGLLIRRKEI